MFTPRRRSKRGELDALLSYIMIFVLVAILLGVSLVVLDNFSTEINDTWTGSGENLAQNSVNLTISALDDLSGWFDIIVVIVAASIILAIVIRAFRGGAV